MSLRCGPYARIVDGNGAGVHFLGLWGNIFASGIPSRIDRTRMFLGCVFTSGTASVKPLSGVGNQTMLPIHE